MRPSTALAPGAAFALLVCRPCGAMELEMWNPYEEPGVETLEGEGPAVDHFNRGVDLFNTKMYEAALAEFLESYSIKPNWAVLYNIGVCHYLLGRYDDAIANLEEYLEKGGGWVPPQREALVKNLLTSMESMVGFLVIRSDKAGAIVWIDGRQALETPVGKPVRVTAGMHSLSAYLEGHEPYLTEVSVAGKATVVVIIDLVPSPLLRTWLEVSGPPRALSPLGRLRIASLAMWSAAGLALAGGLSTGIADLARDPRGDRLRLATTILLASAAGAAVCGLVLWMAFRMGLRHRLAHRVPWLSIAPVDGGAAIVIGIGAWPGSA